MATTVAYGGESALGGEEPAIRLLLSPAPPPVPALKYQLLPTMYERRPGNAAVFYGRVKAERTSFFTNQELWDKIERAQDAPLEEVRSMEGLLTYEPWVLKDLERAGQCASCDWQYPLAEDGFETLVPDVTESRRYARLLNAGARKHLALGEFDQAVQTLKVGYALARHTADAPIITPGLVGVSVTGWMSDGVLELVQQPGAPNLYWALTYLPHPFFDVRRAFEGEMLCIGYQLPQLQHVDSAVKSTEHWRSQLQTTFQVFEEQLGNSEEDVARFRTMMALRMLRGYPLAKRALIAGGMSPAEVHAMPVGQVLLLESAQQFAACRDEHLKWTEEPYWTAAKGLEEAGRKSDHADRDWGAALPVMAFFPAHQAAAAAFVRIDRQIAMLRVIEALRLYGAAHAGRLPARLEEIAEVPIPVDPVTGQPFEYQLEGDVARLGGPRHVGRPLRYEIRFRPEGSR
ncbi:MAG: hypothetical protein GX575_08565 [Candidatus Anammoximicrobium sp.]|nr:hypothetical protein [Candidatus Anammoximicrobium sp.]